MPFSLYALQKPSFPPEAVEDSSLDLSNGHQVWNLRQDKANILTWVMFQFLSPKMEWSPGYFPMRPNRGTLEKTSELSLISEERIHHSYLWLMSSQHNPLPIVSCNFALYNP